MPVFIVDAYMLLRRSGGPICGAGVAVAVADVGVWTTGTGSGRSLWGWGVAALALTLLLGGLALVLLAGGLGGSPNPTSPELVEPTATPLPTPRAFVRIDSNVFLNVDTAISSDGYSGDAQITRNHMTNVRRGIHLREGQTEQD